MNYDKVICDANNVLEVNDKPLGEQECAFPFTKQSDKKCAPGVKYKDGSCLSVNKLVAMVKAYNKHMKESLGSAEGFDKHIELKWSGGGKDDSQYKKYLLKEMNTAMDGICKDQLCWLRQKFMRKLDETDRNEIMNNTIRPRGPQGKFTWLNTTNIDQVMRQYHSTNPEFKFLGTVPVDFDDLEKQYQLSKLDYNSMMKDGTTKVGAIFNLDYHYQDGSHWVGLFADMENGEISFFDSYGSAPPTRIKKYMNVLSDIYKKRTGKDAKQNINEIRHQYDNSECGVYSINFITRLLSGETFDIISKSKVKDEHINQCRQVYFRN